MALIALDCWSVLEAIQLECRLLVELLTCSMLAQHFNKSITCRAAKLSEAPKGIKM